MKITVFTLFPEMFSSPLGASIVKRAIDLKLLHVDLIDFRTYAQTKHKQVDDEPYGGGAGMLLKPEPIYAAVEAIHGDKGAYKGKIILMSPQGEPFSQEMALGLSKEDAISLICGHYEGFDERIRGLADLEVSIGDYVLTGGELPAMVLIDALCRLLPGVLGEDSSAQFDSFSDGLLEHPHFTRPRVFRDMAVPDVLVSGHHEEIRRWRRKESLRRTLLRRPALLEQIELSDEDHRLLKEIRQEEEQ